MICYNENEYKQYMTQRQAATKLISQHVNVLGMTHPNKPRNFFAGLLPKSTSNEFPHHFQQKCQNNPTHVKANNEAMDLGSEAMGLGPNQADLASILENFPP